MVNSPLTDDEALLLIRQSEAEHRDIVDPVPTRRQRLIGAIPLFAAFVVLGCGIRVTLHIQQMHEAMDIFGFLPLLTYYWLKTCAVLAAKPWLLTAGLFAVAWLYFSILAKKRSRARVFAMILVPLIIFGTVCVVILLFLPLIVTLEKFGK